MNATGDDWPPYCCPACRGAVTHSPDAYACATCRLEFPILFGIPDFRVRSDRYLSLADERAKAGRLHDFARDHSFEALVRFYYEITDDVPPARAALFGAYVLEGLDRAAPILAELGPFSEGDRLLDCGCGSGGLVAAAAKKGLQAVGLDIALRWLVIAQKRLQSLGLSAKLVCADAETPPFADRGFSRVVAADVLEHAYDPAKLLKRTAAQLETGGDLWLSASNRFWLGPHPSVGLWGAGLRRPGGSLRNVTLLSPLAMVSACHSAGLKVIRRGPRRIDPRRLGGRNAAVRALAGIYAGLCDMPGAKDLLFVGGPAFELLARKQDVQSSRRLQSPSPAR